MDKNQEIEELKNALSATPENDYLRMMLIRKMQLFPFYRTEMEALIQKALKTKPHNTELKSILIQSYFEQKKYSTCIIIAEEIGNISVLNLEVQAHIAICYLKENDKVKSQNIYQSIIMDDSSFVNEELDNAFRLKSLSNEFEEEFDQSLFTKPDINFSHVGGMDDVKREISLKIIKPLENVELFKSYGKKVGGGILLYGPPGCGKTYIAKATAGEINANFINIGLDDILDMWHGNSEKNLHNYFELARSHKPCVIFFDEVDALGAKRSDLRQSAGKNVINQFLAELDGMQADNDGVLIIGATNMPWHLDTAFRRPGRFDRIIFVPPPDEKSKQAIIQMKLKDKPQKNIDLKKVAKNTPRYSGADINAMIDIAIEKILEDAMATGDPKPITTKDLIAAAKMHKASTSEWFTTAKNYALFANKSGLYDDILKYLK